MDQDEIIKNQRKQIDELEKKLAGALPGMKQLSGILDAFKTDGGMDEINKTVQGLQRIEKDLTTVFKKLSEMSPEALDKLKET